MLRVAPARVLECKVSIKGREELLKRHNEVDDFIPQRELVIPATVSDVEDVAVRESGGDRGWFSSTPPRRIEEVRAPANELRGFWEVVWVKIEDIFDRGLAGALSGCTCLGHMFALWPALRFGFSSSTTKDDTCLPSYLGRCQYSSKAFSRKQYQEPTA